MFGGAHPSRVKGLSHHRRGSGRSCRCRLPYKVICRIKSFGVRRRSPSGFGCMDPRATREARLWQRIIRGNFSAYVDWLLSVIVEKLPRTLKLAGDGEIWPHWQCARSLPPLPNSPRQSHGYFTGDDMRSPCLAGFTPARPRIGREKRESYVRFCEPHPAFHLRPPRLRFLPLGRARHSESKRQIAGTNCSLFSCP